MKIVQKIAVISLLLLSSLSLHAEEKNEVALGGYCPVCYISGGKAVKGKKEYSASHEGKTYLFVSEEAVGAFNKDPGKYLPAYDGWCAYGISLGGKFVSDPKVFKVVDGRLFLNKNAEVGRLFADGTEEHISKADENWSKLKK